jgi:hypothetical protein
VNEVKVGEAPSGNRGGGCRYFIEECDHALEIDLWLHATDDCRVAGPVLHVLDSLSISSFGGLVKVGKDMNECSHRPRQGSAC